MHITGDASLFAHLETVYLGILARRTKIASNVRAVVDAPIYTGPTVHGYEITNYYGFEEDYGTEAEFKQMMNELKNANIKVILDFVVNHTSIQHPFMQNVFQYREYSPYADFYIWSGEPGNSNYDYLFDWATLPNLNHQNPDVRNYFLNVAEYWVRNYDIDGYRCDVAWGAVFTSSGPVGMRPP